MGMDVKVDKVETIPLGDPSIQVQTDLLAIIVDLLAKDVKDLESRVLALEMGNVHTSKQGRNDLTDTAESLDAEATRVAPDSD